MPKMVCTDCQTELGILKTGGFVIEMFNNPPMPYKIWSADIWECPGCHKKVVAGFGNHPLTEHYENNFETYLEKVKNSREAREGYLIYSYEKPKKGVTSEPQKT